MNRYVEVWLSSDTRKTERTFTYRVPEELKEGARRGAVGLVPFGAGNRPRTALVERVWEAESVEFPTKNVLHWAQDTPSLTEEAMALVDFMVETTLSDRTSAMQSVLPPGGFDAFQPQKTIYYQIAPGASEDDAPANAIRQRAVLRLLRNGRTERQQLLQRSGASSETLRALEHKNFIVRTEDVAPRRDQTRAPQYGKMTLTSAQQTVFERIISAEEEYLLCGVTGSGKTEIYLQLVEKALEDGKSAIVLVPEISLTPQTIARFEGRFGSRVAILHSRLTQAERYEEWQKIATGQVEIAIGARSAIFAPFSKLGVIIIDEEHENSYISEKNPKYHTRDIARFRAQYHHCSLVMGSATPSMESLYEASIGKLIRLDLPERANGSPLPETVLVDMRAELKAGNRSMFSRELFYAIKEALSRGEQSILFLNKRGHTSFVFCRTCGYVYRCDACDVAMTWHKHRNRLVCHYCGREKEYKHTCPQCGSDAIREFGAGTEQLEEEVRRYFPRARVVRADADTMRQKNTYERVYQQMLAGEIDILVGTQMIAKGFDFPGVTVVGVISADVNLNLPDLRAAERTFQLMTQVAGRAGRGKKEGKVFLQTYKPEHYALRSAASHDVDGFFEEEMTYRTQLHYPPLLHELNLLFSGWERGKTLQKAREVFADLQHLPEDAALSIQGPAPAVIERMNKRYRFSLVLRHPDRSHLEVIGQHLLERFPSDPSLWVILTIDPANGA